ncbi:MAG TPA: GFA family protein [Kofleriaceae bacterium]|nr:GFA family protein [Kofleriaceae bacterium]
MKQFTGSCQCGAVTYRMARPVAAWVCHCLDCQRMTASAYSFSMATPRATFHWTKGEPRTFTKTGDNGRASEQHFCADCGSWLATTSPAAPDAMIVRVGTLDDHAWIKPVSQAWASSALPWALLPGVPAIDRDATPEQAQKAMVAWQAAHPA